MGVAATGGSELLVMVDLNASISNWGMRDWWIPWGSWGRLGIGVEEAEAEGGNCLDTVCKIVDWGELG